MDLKTFNYHQYLKDKLLYTASDKVFLVNQDTYKHLKIDFPFRTTHYGIGFNYGKGCTECKIGSQEYTLSEGSLITAGPGIVTQWASNYQLKNETVYFNEELFSDIGTAFLRNATFFQHGGCHVIQIEQPDIDKLQGMFGLMQSFVNNDKAMSGLVYSLFQYVDQLHNSAIDPPHSDKPEQITRAFKSLLAKHFIESREVSYYAARLHLSPKYLSEVLQETTGQSAKELINEQIIWETKSLLKQTHMTVQEIADWLGYDDHSYFIRMFKKQTGVTPTEYRKH